MKQIEKQNKFLSINALYGGDVLLSFKYENFEAFLINIGSNINLRYVITLNEKVLFQGDDFKPSPLRNIDDVGNINNILGFIAIQPGDTDKEYFENYNEEQLSFANSYLCERLSGIVSDFDNPEYTGEFQQLVTIY